MSRRHVVHRRQERRTRPESRVFGRHDRQEQTSRALDWRSALRLAIAFGIVVVAVLALESIIRPLILLIAGISIAQALSPIVAYLQRWLPRGISVLSIYLVLLIAIGIAGWIIVPRLIAQAESFVEAAPALLTEAQRWVDQWDLIENDRLIDIAMSQIDRFGGVLAGAPLVIASGAFDIFLIIAISLYWQLASPKLMTFSLSLFPGSRQDEAKSVLVEMGQTMGGYVRGQGIVAVIMGILTYAGLMIIGVQYALFLALIAALLEILPIIGPIIATVPIVLVALLDSPRQAVIVFVFWVVLQQVEAYILTPNVMHSQADVPPLIVLLAIFTGGAALGLLGAIVAIPFFGALRIFIIRVIAPMVREWSGADRTNPVGG
jgi:predicted PurR-regulated permease PerM